MFSNIIYLFTALAYSESSSWALIFVPIVASKNQDVILSRIYKLANMESFASLDFLTADYIQWTFSKIGVDVKFSFAIFEGLASLCNDFTKNTALFIENLDERI